MSYVIRCALLGTCLAARALGADLFVSNTAGDDRRDGRAAVSALDTGPVRTISKALRLAGAGDRIIVANTGRPYHETLTLSGSRHGESGVSPLVIDGGGATLDGSIAIPAEGWQHHADDVYTYGPARLGHQQLFISGRPAVQRPAEWAAVAPPRLERLEWCFWRGRIYFRAQSGRHPRDYELSCCHLRTGVTLYYVQGVLIRDLVVQGFALDGVAVHDVVRDARLLRVTSRANGASGVSVRGASLVELEGCHLSGNGESQLRIADFARSWLYGCRLLDDTAPTIEQSGGHVTIDGRTGLFTIRGPDE